MVLRGKTRSIPPSLRPTPSDLNKYRRGPATSTNACLCILLSQDSQQSPYLQPAFGSEYVVDAPQDNITLMCLSTNAIHFSSSCHPYPATAVDLKVSAAPILFLQRGSLEALEYM